jgi:hypothetical protein
MGRVTHPLEARYEMTKPMTTPDSRHQAKYNLKHCRDVPSTVSRTGGTSILKFVLIETETTTVIDKRSDNGVGNSSCMTRSRVGL